MKRRGISKGTVFPFSSCKCAVILQPERESLAESGAAGWRGVEEEWGGGMHYCIFLEQRFPFMPRQKCVSVCLRRGIICGLDVWETNVEA